MTYYIQTGKISDLVSETTTSAGSIVFLWPYPEVTGPQWPNPFTTRPYLPDTNPWPLSPPQQGWECPRCHRVNAPHVDQCSCGPQDASPLQPWPTRPPSVPPWEFWKVRFDVD